MTYIMLKRTPLRMPFLGSIFCMNFVEKTVLTRNITVTLTGGWIYGHTARRFIEVTRASQGYMSRRGREYV